MWISGDGGISFFRLLSFSPAHGSQFVISFALTDHALSFTTSAGAVYYGRPAHERIVKLDSSFSSYTDRIVLGSDGSMYFINEVPIIQKKSLLLNTKNFTTNYLDYLDYTSNLILFYQNQLGANSSFSFSAVPFLSLLEVKCLA